MLLSSSGTTQILYTLTATNAVETINAPLAIQGAGGTYIFANNSANGAGVGAGTLNFGGGITGGAAGATVLTLSGSNTNANTISGVIANGSATSLSINKSGAGTWKLSGANTFTGSLISLGGTLDVAAGRSVTGCATLNTKSGGALTVAGTVTVANNGTTNVNSALGTGTSTVSVTAATTLKFGSVSQKLSSLTIGAGSTVTFTSGLASFSGGSGGKTASLGGSAVVPEPGTLGLLNRRRRQA